MKSTDIRKISKWEINRETLGWHWLLSLGQLTSNWSIKVACNASFFTAFVIMNISLSTFDVHFSKCLHGRRRCAALNKNRVCDQLTLAALKEGVWLFVVETIFPAVRSFDKCCHGLFLYLFFAFCGHFLVFFLVVKLYRSNSANFSPICDGRPPRRDFAITCFIRLVQWSRRRWSKRSLRESHGASSGHCLHSQLNDP